MFLLFYTFKHTIKLCLIWLLSEVNLDFFSIKDIISILQCILLNYSDAMLINTSGISIGISELTALSSNTMQGLGTTAGQSLSANDISVTYIPDATVAPAWNKFLVTYSSAMLHGANGKMYLAEIFTEVRACAVTEKNMNPRPLWSVSNITCYKLTWNSEQDKQKVIELISEATKVNYKTISSIAVSNKNIDALQA